VNINEGKDMTNLTAGKTYLTVNGKIAFIKSVHPTIAEVRDADGTFHNQAFYCIGGTAKTGGEGLDIVDTLPENTLNAVEWLQAHSQTILGVTVDGVCVLDTGGEGYNLWLPAKRSALRDFMNY
jgi:hypothetical protein